MWKVYILECSDGTYYTGLAEDLNARVDKHNAGKGAEYTKRRKPVKLVYAEDYKDKIEAIKREIEIKKLSHSNKRHLINYGKGVSLATHMR